MLRTRCWMLCSQFAVNIADAERARYALQCMQGSVVQALRLDQRLRLFLPAICSHLHLRSCRAEAAERYKKGLTWEGLESDTRHSGGELQAQFQTPCQHQAHRKRADHGVLP